MMDLRLLLADPSPCLRWLVLDTLVSQPDEAERAELAAMRSSDPLVALLLAEQAEDGSWSGRGTGVGARTRATAVALARLGYLGFGPDFEPVARGAAFLFAVQEADGSWPLVGAPADEMEQGYGMIPQQTTVPLRGLAYGGYAADPRAERAYEWLLAQRLEDGAWPTGIASGVYGRVAGYRKLAHSRWGCRSNTTGALTCLALHPQRRHGAEARRALDLVLGRDTQEQRNLGFEVARLIGAEPTRGMLTFFGRFDVAQMLDLCWRVGADRQDERVAALIGFVSSCRGPYGLWPYVAHPEASRWVTLDLLRSLSQLAVESDWRSQEPPTPFQAYPAKHARY